MNTSTIAESTCNDLRFDCPGVLVTDHDNKRLRDTARFITAAGEQQVVCAVAPPARLRWQVWRVRTDILLMPNGDRVVTSVRRDDDLDPLALTPETFCPIPGTLQAIRTLAGSITHPALRRFLSDVFADFRVFEDFWVAKGGPDHHHWPGGLAVHAAEVAHAVARALGQPAPDGAAWTAEEREVAIVAALVHDIGECRDDGRPLEDRVEAQRQLMELRHLELVHDALSHLHNTNRPIARALLALLFPRQRFGPSGLRVEPLRQILSSAHRASVEGQGSTAHPSVCHSIARTEQAR